MPETASYRQGVRLAHYLPQVAVATLVVAVSPVVAVWLLRAAGVVRSPWICLVLAVALSTALSWGGCAYWKRSKGSGDLLFSELLVWGWLQRWRAERQLARAVRLLGLLRTDQDVRPGEQSLDRHQHLLEQVAAALEAEDRYARGHSVRVARYAASIARKLGLSKREVEMIRAAALVHDVGKFHVASEILVKPTGLTDAELDVIKRHPVDGAHMVAGLRNDELTAIVRHHHERFDGKGYPDGLAGAAIPLGARIIAVADTFDAITSVRAYRPRRRHMKALEILASEQGCQLDRDAVRAFLACYSGWRSVAIWAILTSVLQRTVAWLTGEAGAATIATSGVVATAAATVAIGVAAMASPLVVRAGADHVAGNAHSSARSPRQSGLARQPNGAAIGVRGGSPGLARAAGSIGLTARRRGSGIGRKGRRGARVEVRSARHAKAEGRRPANAHRRRHGKAERSRPARAERPRPAKAHKPRPANAERPRPANPERPRPGEAHEPRPADADDRGSGGLHGPGKADGNGNGHGNGNGT